MTRVPGYPGICPDATSGALRVGKTKSWDFCRTACFKLPYPGWCVLSGGCVSAVGTHVAIVGQALERSAP
eukprot:2272901-Rhodomonas_salina.2